MSEIKRLEAIQLLIEDEEEAINGYEKYLHLFNRNERYVITQIIGDEKKHIEQLKALREGE